VVCLVLGALGIDDLLDDLPRCLGVRDGERQRCEGECE
jgi:hypothetical protein